MRAMYLVLGVIFGFVLSRSGAADYNYIQTMFLFESFQLYGIIGTAVVLTAAGLWALKRVWMNSGITSRRPAFDTRALTPPVCEPSGSNTCQFVTMT